MHTTAATSKELLKRRILTGINMLILDIENAVYPTEHRGICSYLYAACCPHPLPHLHADCTAVDNIIQPMFRTWGDFSGNLTFPVPDPDGLYYSDKPSLACWEGPYGGRRYNLAVHIRKELIHALSI